MIHRLALALTAAGALIAAGCGVNDYCLNCGTDAGDGDAIVGDATADGNDGNVTPPDACVPTGVETCNGMDDDCDGMVDDGVATVGDPCGTDVGECSAGVIECAAGALRCTGVSGSPETCDSLDNNCNGMADEGNPGGGVPCGTDVGECVAGTTTCVGGAIDCVGDVGTVGGNPEICDGKDNDCDNNFDEGLPPLGSCGTTGVGECALGTLTCVGGVPTCVGDVGPTLELCDTLDQDCDGNPTNGFNLNTDPRNCGSCNRVCDLPHAVEGCGGGNCTVANCDPDFYNVNGMAADGCEYGCQYQGPTEACNQQDDNCNGQVDESLTPPAICLSLGACAGTMPVCTAAGWDCAYGPNVSTDAAGDVVPENRCDNIDNDCDGRVDEGHPLKGTACTDSGVGVCQGRGTYVCDAGNPTGAVTCNITQPGGTASAELCDNLDNNCNGTIDDNAAQDWVSIGGGRQVMKWEASHPDATATNGGAVTARACSKAGVLPWTNVTYGQARTACMAIGGDLCTEQDWHRACSVVTKSTFPLAAPAAATGFVFVEAEDYLSATTATSTGTGAALHAWVPDSAPADYSGISAMRASPNLGANVSQANAPTQAPRLDYQFNFPATGAATNYYIWVRMYSPVGADDTIYPGINTALPGTASALMVTPTNGTWLWVVTPAFSIPAAGGNRYVSLWMREDGVKVDMIALSRQNSTAPTAADLRTHGGTWSYAANPTTYQLGTCNEDNYDTSGAVAGDQDDILVGGNRASCYANWGGTNRIQDLSGNVKEWTIARLPGINPLRGGASNNEGTGITCDLAFTSAGDTFFFPNVGFRCCR